MSAPLREPTPPPECALSEGFGLPMTGPIGRAWAILLDGMPIDNVVAYSTPQGWLARYQEDSCGRLVRKGDGFATERLDGEVRVVRRAERVAALADRHHRRRA